MDNEILLQEPWLRWAIEIQSLAQCGLTYTKDPYDAERYKQLRNISSEMLSYKTGIPTDKVKEIFCSESGYQTPKLDTRAAVFQEGRILLVHENNGTWSLPGGCVDVLESVGSNTVKEVREESGLEVKPVKLIAVQDRNKHNTPPYAYGVCKVFVLCDTLGGRFTKNIETTETGYFSMDDLPLLAEEKCTRAQIRMCFDAFESPRWETLFD